MEKLSNQQIDAIAYDIKDKVQKSNIQNNKIGREAKHAAFLKSEKGKLAQKFYKTFGGSILPTFLDLHSGVVIKPTYLDLQIIRNKIILGTIDCKDYKDLTDKLLKEFLSK